MEIRKLASLFLLLVFITLAIALSGCAGSGQVMTREDVAFHKSQCVSPKWWDGRAQRCRSQHVPMF